MPDLTITLYFGHAKKTKKSSFELPTVLNDTKSSNLDILESIYYFFAHIANQNSKFLLFSKSDDYTIGREVISSNTYLLSYLKICFREFLFISLNKNIFDCFTAGSFDDSFTFGSSYGSFFDRNNHSY